jgi:hypothetical protein
MVFCKFYKLYPVLVSMLCGSVRTKGISGTFYVCAYMYSFVVPCLHVLPVVHNRLVFVTKVLLNVSSLIMVVVILLLFNIQRVCNWICMY